MSNRQCDKCSHKIKRECENRNMGVAVGYATSSSYGSISITNNDRRPDPYCDADRQLSLDKQCDKYFPKQIHVLVVAQTKERAIYKLKELDSSDNKWLNEVSFISKDGDLYVACGIGDELRGRKSNEIWVDGSMLFSEAFDIVAQVINYDVRRLKAI